MSVEFRAWVICLVAVALGLPTGRAAGTLGSETFTEVRQRPPDVVALLAYLDELYRSKSASRESRFS